MNNHGLHELPYVVVAAAIIQWEGKILLTRRRLDVHQGGLWEFPGGKREVGETLEECLQRELKEEIDIEVRELRQFYTLRHRYPEKDVELHFFTCSVFEGSPKTLDCIEMAWVLPRDLASYEFPAADALVLREMQKRWPE